MPKKISKKETAELVSFASMSEEEAKKVYFESLASSNESSSSNTLSRSATGGNGGAAIYERWANIYNSPQPFYYVEGNFISPYDTINMCQKAYNSFPLLRNIIEIMVELASSPIVLRGGNAKSKAYVEAWMEKVGMNKLAECFFREWWRSGSVFITSLNGNLQKADVDNLNKLYDGVSESIPLLYTILNPLYVRAKSTLNYQNPIYLRVFSDFEIARLRNPKTTEDKAIFNALDPEVKKQMKTGGVIQIDPDTLTILLYKNQPYEPFATPMAFPLLDAIEAKMDLLRMDKAVARAADRIMFLVTVGSEVTEYNKGNNINYHTISMLQQMLNQPSVMRTLVVDFSTKADFKIPDLNKVLGATKYEQLNNDILVGLNAAIFDPKEKFANASIKVKIFLERLKEARRTFMERFLNKEIKKICKAANVKSIPVAEFTDISLKDDLSWAQITAQLYTVGLLTAEEALENLDTGIFPTSEESLEHQKDFSEMKQDGLYQPLTGNSVALQQEMGDDQLAFQKQQAVMNLKQQQQQGKQDNLQNQMKSKEAKEAGKPKGTKVNAKPRSKITPMGASENEASNEQQFSMAKLIEVSKNVMGLQNRIEAELKKKYKLKELADFQLTVAKDIVAAIISNEEDWMGAVKDYIKEPKTIEESVANEITEIATAHDIDDFLAASILRLAKKD